jgi:CRP-like cAMP-binding protein
MRIVKDPKIEMLACLPLFEGCSTAQLAEISAAAERITIERFQDLTREGASDNLVYVIVHGMVQVRRGDRVLAYLQDGHVVGELAALDGQPRSATVTTVVDTDLVLIDRRHLGPMLDHIPQVAARLEDVAQRRRAA